MTKVIIEVEATEISISNKNAGISISLEKALSFLPEHCRPVSAIWDTSKLHDCLWYDWNVGESAFSMSSELVYLDGENDNLFILFTISEGDNYLERHYNIITGEQY